VGISTHILDTTRGRPAAGVAVRLECLDAAGPALLAEGATDADGRARLLADAPAPGTYRLTFAVGPYFEGRGVEAFYPEVQVQFSLRPGAGDHFHVPLLLNPFGYSTYRGS
jgi:5-hydroxyisourate hydrolase